MKIDKDIFKKKLEKIFIRAEEKGLSEIVIKAGELHRSVGGYPGTDHRMPTCCHVMKKAMREGDRIINKPPKGKGASFHILYKLPR